MFSFHNFGKNWNDNLITARGWNKTYILIDFHVKTISTYIPKVHACRGSRPFYNVDWVLRTQIIHNFVYFNIYLLLRIYVKTWLKNYLFFICEHFIFIFFCKGAIFLIQNMLAADPDSLKLEFLKNIQLGCLDMAEF